MNSGLFAFSFGAPANESAFIFIRLTFILFMLYFYYERLGRNMAFIVGCFVGLVVGVLFSVVVKALKESSF